MADLYALVHRDTGPVETYLTRDAAERAMEAMLADEPDWRPDVWVEPFCFTVRDERTLESP